MKALETSMIFTAAIAIFATQALAKDTSYIGAVEVISGDAAPSLATGTVFLDANRNSELDAGEAGIEGVSVSNGREVTLTDAEGVYRLPIYDDMNLFITKPAGYAVPVDETMVPQFNYIHKIQGSPDLRFAGIEPTGPMPAAVNFPLIEDNSDRDEFECLVFGDAQPYFNMQISYVRETAGKMLAARDNADTECLLFAGDIMGDDLSLYPRFKKIIALGDTPQYYVGGNHDLDLDAADDAHSFDTFRREWGPEYYSFDIGNVHFVTLDNVRYPCNGIDDHPFCDLSAKPTYNGVIHDRQLRWLENDLFHVPKHKLIVISVHIPFQSFTDNTTAKHQTDNLAALVEILGDRPTLGLSGHTHTTENILTGEYYEGWEENTGIGPAPFHQIVTGSLSGSWWSGSLNDDGVPGAPQRLGSPRGFYSLRFAGSDYVDSYKSFTHSHDEQFHVSFNSPRYRKWAMRLSNFVDAYGELRADILPPVSVNDLGDANMLTRKDLQDDTWAVINLWNGNRDSKVVLSIAGGEPIEAIRTQAGEGEAKIRSIEASDPYAVLRQVNDTRRAIASATGNDGYEMFKGAIWAGKAGPLDRWLWTDSSSHLWRAELPADLPTGIHSLTITVTDHHGRKFHDAIAFEVVDEIPDMTWQGNL
ncbi:MAG: calcineurin-like phosphoesterase C-terminal domain-containing protein [Ectothiorhodospiraceae bacterium AqS1]|nr:calcineurin-like phosphoesterase C-terminal domain-containing protein [Ectothiorhodospiraceae bacterium AqS1]